MARRPKPVHELTNAQFEAMFSTEDDCCAYLVARRWPEGVRCPRCKSEKVLAVISRTGAIHMVTDDVGYTLGTMLAPDRMELCYMHVSPASHISSCTEMKKQP